MAGNTYQDGGFTGPWATVTACNDSSAFAAGQLGKTITLGGSSLNPPSYMYVQRKGSDTACNTGKYFMTMVTATQMVVGIGGTVPVGVFLGDDDQTDITLKGLQSGNYGFIQTKGIANCIAVTSTAASTVGNVVAVNTTGQITTAATNVPTAGILITATTADGGVCQVLLDIQGSYVP